MKTKYIYPMLHQKNRISIIGKSFLLILFIVVFEGAIRKWLIPSAGIPLMLIRDLIAIGAIFFGINLRYFKFKSFPEFSLLVWTFIVMMWSLLQFVFEIIPFPVIFIGFRSWILYAWFALLCYRALRPYDVEVILKVLLLSLLPMVVLSVIQFMSPVHSFINKQPGEGSVIFIVVKDIVRTTGTFTFTMGYTTYLALLSPLVLWMMSKKTIIFKNSTIRLLVIVSFFLGVLVSGSRATLLFTASMFGFFIISMFFSGAYKKISSRSFFLGSIFIIITGYYTFPILEKAYNANISRIQTASMKEDVSTRIIETFIGSAKTWENMDIFGSGIGAGSNAARSFMPKGKDDFVLGEMEIDRILNEGGLIGIFFSLFKLLIALYALTLSFKIMIKEKNMLVFLFWTYLTVQLLTSSMTGQITVHAFLFLSLGIGWTLLRSSKHRLSYMEKFS